MSLPHEAHWPPGLPRSLTLPRTSVSFNLEVSARRYPDKPCLIFYESVVTYRDAWEQVERIAGYLQADCGVRAGDRVLLYMQNSPQWILAWYGIVRADAVVVPVNPMNRTEELRHVVDDSGAQVAFAAQELVAEIRPLLSASAGGLRRLIVATYADYLHEATDLPIPDFVKAQPVSIDVGGHDAGMRPWPAIAAADRRPGPGTAGPDDLCVMPYTSGTTGAPKGCRHTHRSVMSTLVGGIVWFGRTQDAIYLTTLPLFHVTGMAGSMNGPIYAGATIVVLPRWDRTAAIRMIERHRVTVWQCISTMMIDFLSDPDLTSAPIASLQCVRGGGAAMPAAIVEKLKRLTGLDYIEGYGMSETMAATHINPLQRPKAQCLGIPVFDVDARVVDPLTLRTLPPGETGEIIVAGPQLMAGYWNDPAADAEAFVQLDGRRFLRTGDLAQTDADGYFFMVDRLKRMINASGYKVWPAEVEALMDQHPAIRETCVIAARDARRGETVKALVVLAPDQAGRISEQAIIDWARTRMAAYKCPRIVEFVSSLPISGSGKVLWRALQEAENRRSAARD